MNLNYTVQDLKCGISFCEDKEVPDIINDIKKNFSDKKLLLVIDNKLSSKFLKYLYKDLGKLDLKIDILKIEATKKNKNHKVMFKIIDKLIKNKFTKKSVLISCGGGVVGDLCALASSLYLRGLIYYHIPTTMTAIVDSCIGGKTGINYRNIINSVGNYYHPKRVFISKNVLNLIPKREFIAGVPEIIKSGLIKDYEIIKLLIENKKKFFNKDYRFLKKLISKTLKTKIFFFKNDVFENSKRLNLNFGHTFAHAIEMTFKSNKGDIIRHGEAVGIGMLCEIYYNEGRSKSFNLIKNLLETYELPTNILSISKNRNKKQIINSIYKNIFLDKKRIGKFPRIINIKKINSPKIVEMKSLDKIKQTISKVLFNKVK